MKPSRKLLLTGTMFGALMTAIPAHAIPVGLELSLLVDVSGSIDSEEYDLQLQGYADAFRSADVQAAIDSNDTNSIAVNMIMWASPEQQVEVLPWTQVYASTVNDFADILDSIVRPFDDGTAPQTALNYAATYANNINANNFESDRQIMDVSSDGPRKSGLEGTEGRDAAVAAGYDVINAITIGADPDLIAYYADNVQYGIDSFTLAANDFNDFGTAISAKLATEIGGPQVPVGATLPLLAGGLGLFALSRRRRATK
ncbi:DUF1194 domain-containing protein [Allohahella marinimesophila]|uniref:DUF1194 domain-containing protein n=1 Tax=Allohahella marinimesophila TaxID=1054972 RepID=A0ABP7NSM8_9GAMM